MRDIVPHHVGNKVKAWNIAAQTNQCMHLDGRLGAAKRCPRKQHQAQVDCYGVQDKNRVRHIQTEIFPLIQGACLGDQALGKGGIDPPVSALVGIGQRGTFHWQANIHVVQLSRFAESLASMSSKLSRYVNGANDKVLKCSMQGSIRPR